MSNTGEGLVGIVSEFSPASNAIDEAAHWLAHSRDEVAGSIIAEMKRRFGLRNLDAIEACKKAHEILFGTDQLPEPTPSPYRLQVIEGGDRG